MSRPRVQLACLLFWPTCTGMLGSVVRCRYLISSFYPTRQPPVCGATSVWLVAAFHAVHQRNVFDTQPNSRLLRCRSSCILLCASVLNLDTAAAYALWCPTVDCAHACTAAERSVLHLLAHTCAGAAKTHDKLIVLARCVMTERSSVAARCVGVRAHARGVPVCTGVWKLWVLFGACL